MESEFFIDDENGQPAHREHYLRDFLDRLL